MKINAKILSDKIAPDMLQPKTPGSAGIDLMAVEFQMDYRGGYIYLYPGQCEKNWHWNSNTPWIIPGYATMVLHRVLDLAQKTDSC